MKHSNRIKKRIALLMAVLTFPALIGCGSRNSGNTQPPVDNGVYPLPPGPNYPLPPGVGGGCMPLTGQIGFTGQGIYVSYANIRGGQLPNAGSGPAGGQILLGGPGGSGPYQIQTYEGTRVSMSIDPIGGQPYPQQQYAGGVQYPQNTSQNIVVPGQASINGSITLSQLTLSDISYRMGGYQTQQTYNQYPQQYPQQYPNSQANLCVTGMGIDIGHYGTRLYGGKFYLYMNNGQVYELPI